MSADHQDFAVARLQGSPQYPNISGTVWFQNVPGGTFISVKVTGLPPYQPAPLEGIPLDPTGSTSMSSETALWAIRRIPS